MTAPGAPDPADEAPDVDVGPLRYHAGDLIADKYRLEELLGEGGMGSVWRAKNLALDADVAVKLVHSELLGADSSERLRREAHATARLEHPSALRVFDLGETWLGDSFIVMELLRGKSLRQLLEERVKLSPLELVPLALPILSAVAAAHAKGIVHRDLKPENIMLVEDEVGHVVPKVLDFGIAKVEGPARSGRATQAGTILGSPEYMSPEQARGEVDAVDARSDLWALGVVLYEALSGRSPFGGGHPLAMLRAVIEEDVPSLESQGLADAALSAIVERAMKKPADERFEDARTMGRALAEWATSRGLDTDATGASIAAHWLRDASLAGLRRGGPGALARLSAPDDAPGSSARRSQAETLPGPSAREPSAPRLAPLVEVRPRPSRGRALAVGALALAVGLAGTFAIVKLAPNPKGGDASSPPSPQASAAEAPAPPSSALPSDTEAPTPSAATTASGHSEAQASAAPSASAAAPPAPTQASSCVAGLFPDDAFHEGADLGFVCAEADPRRVATKLHSEITREGLAQARTTEAMRLWALLGWYELALVATARGACCSEAEAVRVDLPPSVGACPELRVVLGGLGAAVRAAEDPERALADFRLTASCVERGYRLNKALDNPYAYRGPVGSGAESAYRRVLERARAVAR